MSAGSSTDRLLFGEWLVSRKKVDPNILRIALETQNAEKSGALRSSPRLLGQILLDDFQVFRNRVELNHALIEFEQVKAAIAERKEELHIHEPLPPPVKPKAKGAARVSYSPVPESDSHALFGQFLIEKRKINLVMLEKALEIQATERQESLRRSHRLLGEILLDEFNVFQSRVELNRILIEFNEFKARLEAQRTELMYLSGENTEA